jgi:uncharacterized RDD family membrane protein YckC
MSGDVVNVTPPGQDWSDPWARPELYDGVTLRRVLAYATDAGFVLGLSGIVWFAVVFLGFLSMGLLWSVLPLSLAVIPFAYHIGFLCGHHSATLGMRLFGLKLLSIPRGGDGFIGRPTPIQVIIQIVSFYGSVALTGGLILVVALFNSRRRTLHDWLAGTVVVKLPPDATI